MKSRNVRKNSKLGPSRSKKSPTLSKKYGILAYFINNVFDLSDGYDVDMKQEKKFINKFKREAKKHNIKIIGSQIGADEQSEMFLDAYLSGKKKDILLLLNNLKSKRYTIKIVK